MYGIQAHELKLSHCTSADTQLLLCLLELFPDRRLSLICRYEAAVFSEFEVVKFVLFS